MVGLGIAAWSQSAHIFLNRPRPLSIGLWHYAQQLISWPVSWPKIVLRPAKDPRKALKKPWFQGDIFEQPTEANQHRKKKSRKQQRRQNPPNCVRQIAYGSPSRVPQALDE